MSRLCESAINNNEIDAQLFDTFTEILLSILYEINSTRSGTQKKLGILRPNIC